MTRLGLYLRYALGLLRVSLRVSPRTGYVGKDQVYEKVLEFPAHSSAGGRMMTDTWRDAGTMSLPPPWLALAAEGGKADPV